MRVIEIPSPGEAEVLTIGEAPDPQASPGHVVVDVRAAGVNRADIIQRQGFYAPPPGATSVPGLEAAGVVAELGPGVTGWQVGDRVAVLLSGGGYAEKVEVPAGQLLPIPDSLDFAEAAALPEVVATVYSNLYMAAHLEPGAWLLVHGGTSGIGTMAIQMARALGSRVLVTVGTEEKATFARELGADAVINHRTEDFVARTQEITADNPHGPGADVVFDIIGAKYLARNIEALAPDGELVIIGMQGGRTAEIDLNALLTGRKSVRGTTLRARSIEQKAAIVAAVRAHVWPLIADGRIAPVIDSVLPVGGVSRAHTLLETGAATGKVVLDTTGDAWVS